MTIALSYRQSALVVAGFVVGSLVAGGLITGMSVRHLMDAESLESAIIVFPLIVLGLVPLLFEKKIEKFFFRNLASDSAYHEYLKREKKRKQQIDRLPEDYGRFLNGVLMVNWITVISIFAIVFGLHEIIKIYEGQILDDGLMCWMIWANCLFIIPAYVWIVGRSYFRTKYPDYPSRIIPPSK